MEEKPNYFAIIPASVRYDNSLRANEKLLYGEITALSKQTGECWASNKYFCELYNVKPNAIATWIRHLKERKYIDVDYEYIGKEIQKRIIRIGGIQKDNTYSQKDTGVFTNEYGGYSQKGEENNTSNINNTSINNKEIYKESIEEIINYLNNKIDTHYRTTTPKTKQLITARLNEGFKVDDFKTVIDNKYSTWFKDKKMCNYLRPETLFGTKFENYLNEKVKKRLTDEELINMLKEMDKNETK